MRFLSAWTKARSYGVFVCATWAGTPSSPGVARTTTVILVTRSGTVWTVGCCATWTSTTSGARAWATVARTCGCSTTERASWENGVSIISRCAPGTMPNTASSVGTVGAALRGS